MIDHGCLDADPRVYNEALEPPTIRQFSFLIVRHEGKGACRRMRSLDYSMPAILVYHLSYRTVSLSQPLTGKTFENL